MSTTVARRIAELARQRPDSSAWRCAGLDVGWGAYDAASTRLAASLADLGLEPGERVAVLLPDGPGVHIAFVATEKAGLVALGIGPRAGQREIVHLLGLTRASALVSRGVHQGIDMAGLVDELRAAGLPVRHHLVVEGELLADEALRVDGRVLEPGEPPDPNVLAGRALRDDDLFLLNSTSGTTGMPKCVTHDQRRWLAFHALAVRHGGLCSDDVFMSAVPAPFGFGLWTAHVSPTLLGAPTVLLPRFTPEAALAAIEEHRVTVLAAVSTQFIMMLGSPAIERHDLSSLRVLFTGGEAVPYERAAAFEERTGARVLQFYGSNETGAVSGTALDDSREKRLRTAGRPIPEMHVRLFDDDGNDVTSKGRGQPGCKGPTLSRGYYGEGAEVAAANAELLREDGWMMLGDLVELDAEGYLRVVGRTDDFIIRGGKNISGPAVEEQVATHPAVALTAAVAMPDETFGERVCVYVELEREAEALDLDALVAHLLARGASKETLPERLVIVDALPRGSGGKIAKQALREDIARRLDEERA